MTSTGDDTCAVLAGLRSESSEERVAAAELAVAKTDLNLVPPEEEPTAVQFHDAAAAIAAGGACEPLAAMLRATPAEQQAACSALRCIFNVLILLRTNGHRMPARWTGIAEVIASAADELYAGGAAESLCAIVESAPDHTSAGNAVCALRLILLASGWRERLDACLNTDATLSSLLALVGGAIQPRVNNPGVSALNILTIIKTSCGARARPLCSPGVLSGGALAVLVALFAFGDVNAGGLLLRIIRTEGAAARAALVRCRHTLAAAAFDVLTQPPGSTKLAPDSVLLLSHFIQEAVGSSWFSDALLGPLLQRLTRVCCQSAPAEMALWRSYGGASAPLNVSQQARLMVSVHLLACLATSPRIAALIKTLLVPAPDVLSKAIEMQEAMTVPSCNVLRTVPPLCPAAVRELDAAQRKLQRAQAREEDNAGIKQPPELDQRPLLVASFADNLTEHARTALVRANAVECHEAAIPTLPGVRLSEWLHIITSGFCATNVGGCRTPFAYTSGLHYMLRGPEMLVVADMPDVASDVLVSMAGRLCWHAGNHVLDAVSKLGQPPDGAIKLAHTGTQLAECDVQLIPWAFEQFGGGTPPRAVTAAAADISWRFVPMHSRIVEMGGESAAMDCVMGAVFGRSRATFYVDVACANEEALMTVPTLMCSIAESLATDRGSTVLQALRSLTSGEAAAHGGVCTCATCEARRACGAVCGNPACTAAHEPQLLNNLKKCGRCKAVAYCSVVCQRSDWPRHKLNCAPPA